MSRRFVNSEKGISFGQLRRLARISDNLARLILDADAAVSVSRFRSAVFINGFHRSVRIFPSLFSMEEDIKFT